MTLKRGALSVLYLALIVPPVLAQSTAFTYQGHLRDAATPADGLYDFRFRLVDSATGGTQIGSTLCVDNVEVVDGLFTVQLDFGQQFATTAERYLEIHVRRNIGQPCTDDFGYVLLSPRQQLTATPLASHANAAFALDAADGSPASAVFADNEGNVGIGTATPVAKLDVRGGAMSVENLGDQADLLWLASERSWVFRQEGTGVGTALKLQSIGGGGNKNFIVQTEGNVGIGTTAPQAKFDVRGDIRLGPAGLFRAAAGEENLRILRGQIGANGQVDLGSGFSVTHPETGKYQIAFTTPFSGTPIVTATAYREFETAEILMMIQSITPTSAVLVQRNVALGEWWDQKFDFIAIGPR